MAKLNYLLLKIKTLEMLGCGVAKLGKQLTQMLAYKSIKQNGVGY